MKINNLEKFLAKARGGELPLGAVVTFADPAVTELTAEAGFDFVWIDGEHGEMDRFSAMCHLIAVKGTDCASFYRVPSCDHTEIKRVIDFAPAGAACSSWRSRTTRTPCCSVTRRCCIRRRKVD